MTRGDAGVKGQADPQFLGPKSCPCTLISVHLCGGGLVASVP